MFKCILGIERNGMVHSFWARLEGCPGDGLAAVDWRRAHGLPEAPTDVIELPGFGWEDEEFVRAAPEGRANREADLDGEGAAGRQRSYGLFGKETVSGGHTAQLNSNRHAYTYQPHPQLWPDVAKEYLAAQTPETARAVFLDLWDGERRSLEKAEAQAAAAREERLAKESALEAARQLLKGELDQLRSKAEQAQTQADYYRTELERLQEQDAEESADVE